MNTATSLFKWTLIWFWALWWTTVFLTDFLGGLKHLGFPHASWITDANYPMLVKSLQLYPLLPSLASLLFVLIIAWSLLASLVFWRVVFTSYQNSTLWRYRMKIAFFISLELWLAFFLSDQVIMNFDLEQNHMIQGGFSIINFTLSNINS